MIAFERIIGPYGIPVFYSQMPAIVKSTSVAWVVYTGSGDDSLLATPGLYHWFEHVPFRGTKKYPGGYSETKGAVTKFGGRAGAWTGRHCTTYWATVPTRLLNSGLELVTELVANPLVTDQAIIDERTVIAQEIKDKLAGAEGYAQYYKNEILYEGHPLAGHPLGSIESLNSTDPNLLRLAKEKGYGRSRMAFFVASALPSSEILRLVCLQAENLPTFNVSERKSGARFGPLPWSRGKDMSIETPFSSSLVSVLFPLMPVQNHRERVLQEMLRVAFQYGGLGSPLYRAVREERKLSYRTYVDNALYPDGGHFGFTAVTNKDNVSEAGEVLLAMIDNRQARSQKWFEQLKIASQSEVEMTVIDPDHFVQSAISESLFDGTVISLEDTLRYVEEVTHDEFLHAMDRLRPEDARTISFVGKG